MRVGACLDCPCYLERMERPRPIIPHGRRIAGLGDRSRLFPERRAVLPQHPRGAHLRARPRPQPPLLRGPARLPARRRHPPPVRRAMGRGLPAGRHRHPRPRRAPPRSPEHQLIGRATQVVLITADVAGRFQEWSRKGVRFMSAPRLRRIKYEPGPARPHRRPGCSARRRRSGAASSPAFATWTATPSPWSASTR